MTSNLSVSLPLLIPILVLLAGSMVLLFVGKVPLSYNVRNLAVRWKTTVLTAIAFTLVISLLTVMLAFVNGMDRLSEGSGQPGNVMILSDGATDELVSNLAYSDSGDVGQQPAVMRDDQNRPLCSREVYVIVTQPLPALPGVRPRRRFAQVRGIEDPAIASEVHGLNLFPGGAWFSPAGVQAMPGRPEKTEQAVEAVLGSGIARVLGQDKGKPQLVIGDLFELGPRQWVVVGIMESAGSTFDSEIWAKRELIGPMFGKENYTSIIVRTRDGETAETFAKDMTANFKKAALQAQPETAYFSKLAETNKQFLFAFIFLAVFMAIGGVFGVMNTMFAAISQRTKDIAVLRIMGFGRRQILVSFLIESLVIALIGGLIGLGIGCLANGWTATSVMSSGMGGGMKFVVLKLVVNGNTLAIGLLLTLAMGTLGGFLPALSAMRLRPLESLR